MTEHPEGLPNTRGDVLAHEQRRARRPASAAQLARSPDDAMLGGVIGGIGAYVAADPRWLRLGFCASVLMSAGVTAVVYLVLWLLLPARRVVG